MTNSNLPAIKHFLKKRLQNPLPFENIENEDIDENLKRFVTHLMQNPPYPIRICAVMVVLFEKKGQICLSFILRPTASRVHPGQIAFPGGGREDQDIDLEATAIRETVEEIGINVPTENILGRLSDIYVGPSNSLITPIVAFLDHAPTYLADPKEVAQVLEVSLSDLQNETNHSVKEIKTKLGAVKMPAFLIDEHNIWGATARILRELIKLLEELN